MTRTCDVVIQSLVYGGSGIARLPDGQAVFVPFVLPGERVRISICEERKGYVLADALEILQPSPLRIPPRCKHFTACGGCHYQHISYEQQVIYKEEILMEQLRRLGGFQPAVVSPAVPSAEPWQYRNSLQFHLSPRGRLGFKRSHTNQTLEISECHLPLPAISQVWPQIDMEYLPEMERVELRQGDDEEVLLVLYSHNSTPPEFEIELPLSAVQVSPAGQILLAGEDHLFITVLENPLRVNAASFFQVNIGLAEKMVSLLLEKTAINRQSVVLDAYCGVGLFSRFIAPLAGRCIAIENSPAACRDFAFNLDEFDNVALYEGLVEAVLPLLEEKPDLVILDPPRNGVRRRALAAILKMAPRQIVYFSCNPATLARDGQILLSAGYQLKETIFLDMFPQTYPIESMNIFIKTSDLKL